MDKDIKDHIDQCKPCQTTMQQQGKSTLDWEQCLAPLMFYYNTSINKSTKITPLHATFNYNPRVPL
jgi:hypothetical protein